MRWVTQLALGHVAAGSLVVVLPCVALASRVFDAVTPVSEYVMLLTPFARTRPVLWTGAVPMLIAT